MASFAAMQEVSGPVIAIALVLAAVFLPSLLLEGITGTLFKQFAVTIAISMLISAFNALTLSPALCALLLKPRNAGRKSLFFPISPFVQPVLRTCLQRLYPHVRKPGPQAGDFHPPPVVILGGCGSCGRARSRRLSSG
ncbi:MAG: efflux RND transporter permease subunit [Akkermansia muciniphila]